MDDRYKEVEDDIPHEGFTFIGNISLIDPPKPGVPEAVSPLSKPIVLSHHHESSSGHTVCCTAKLAFGGAHAAPTLQPTPSLIHRA
jgi:hypothetical protein